MAASLSTTIDYRIIKAKRASDKPAFWKEGTLYIVVQQRDISAVGLTLEEQTNCQLVANEKRVTLDSVILNLKLNKAGRRQFAELKAQGKLPKWPGSKSLQSETTEIVTPGPTTARSLLSGLAGAAKTLLGSSDNSAKPGVEIAEEIEISTYESGNEETLNSSEEDSLEQHIEPWLAEAYELYELEYPTFGETPRDYLVRELRKDICKTQLECLKCFAR